MKRNMFRIGMLAVLLTSPFLLQAKLSKKQDKLITKQLNEFPINTEFSVAIIEGNQPKYLGKKKTENGIVTLDNKSRVFEIGSISKVFTATILANLVHEKQVHLDSSIQAYLDFPIKPGIGISILQLANHTSGLPRLPQNLDLTKVNPANPYQSYGPADLKVYLSEMVELDNPAGQVYAYSNLGAGLLGYVMEQQTGLSYEELLKRYILSKFKMTQTTTNLEQVKAELVPGLNGQGQVTSNWEFDVLVGAGGILSSVNDLTKFVLAQFDAQNKALALSRESTFQVPIHKMAVGLAWNLIQGPKGKTWHMHNGATGGYSSMMLIDIEANKAVVILSNVSGFNPKARAIDALSVALMKTL